MKNVLLAFLFIMIFASFSEAAERSLGAVAGTQARSAAGQQSAAQLGAGGSPGYDLRAISSPRTTPQTFTGFPAGTLPGGDTAGGREERPVGRAVYSGDPLPPVIGPEMVGSKLDRISVVAGHVGYTIARMGYSTTVMDTPYTFALMHGSRRISKL